MNQVHGLSRFHPKSAKVSVLIFLSKSAAELFKAHVIKKAMRPNERVFPAIYSLAPVIATEARMLVGVKVSPLALRRNAATHASVQLEAA